MSASKVVTLHQRTLRFGSDSSVADKPFLLRRRDAEPQRATPTTRSAVTNRVIPTPRACLPPPDPLPRHTPTSMARAPHCSRRSRVLTPRSRAGADGPFLPPKPREIERTLKTVMCRKRLAPSLNKHRRGRRGQLTVSEASPCYRGGIGEWRTRSPRLTLQRRRLYRLGRPTDAVAREARTTEAAPHGRGSQRRR
jgi:hypothetical protein